MMEDNKYDEKPIEENEYEEKPTEENEYDEKPKFDDEYKRKPITECTENHRSILEDLLTVIPDSNENLLAIADDLEAFHRSVTIVRNAGSSLGIAGGVVTVAGLALAPFTFGTSWVVIGLGAAVAGGVTRAGATIADIVNMKKKCSEAEDILKKVDTKLKAFEAASKELHSLVKDLEAVEKTGEFADALRIGERVALAGFGVGGIVNLERLSAIAARGIELSVQAVQQVTVISGVFTALFIVFDAVLLGKGVEELDNDTKMAVTEIKKHAEEFKTLHQNLEEIDKDLKSIE